MTGVQKIDAHFTHRPSCNAQCLRDASLHRSRRVDTKLPGVRLFLRSWLAIGPLSPFIRRLSSQVPLRKLALWTSQRADFVERQCLGRGRVAEHALSSARLNHLVFRRRNETPVDARRGGEPQYFPQNSGTDVCQRYFSTF